jgi:hypothetical protein
MQMTVILAVALVALGFVANTVAGLLFGAACGWFAGWLFPGTFATALGALGLGALEPWQFGMFLGFVAAFFRYTSAD